MLEAGLRVCLLQNSHLPCADADIALNTTRGTAGTRSVAPAPPETCAEEMRGAAEQLDVLISAMYFQTARAGAFQEGVCCL